MTTGEIIKFARTSSGQSQDDLADILGVTKNYISQLENNKKVASVESLKKIAETYSIPSIVLLWDKMLPEAQTEEEQAIINDLVDLIEKTKQKYVDKYLNKKSKKLNIKSKKHLFLQLKLNEDFVEHVINNFSNEYSNFSREDKKGKVRNFSNPSINLRTIQKKVNKLLDRIEFPESIQGGISGRSIISHAKIHEGKSYVSNYDLKNFFPSIKSWMVYRSFIDQDCSPDVASILTRLTTADGKVPQGFLTSPKIAGLVLTNINNRLEKLLSPLGFKFSFWVDDLTISGNDDISKVDKKIQEIFSCSPLELNFTKTKHFGPNDRQECVGLVVNSSTNKCAEIRKKLKNELIAVKKFGLENYLETNNILIDKFSYIRNLKGRVAFMVQVNKDNEKYLSLLKDILKNEEM